MEKKSVFDSGFLLLILIPMFEPTIFAKISFIHYSYSVLLFFSFVLLILIYIKANEKVPRIIIPILIYRLLLLVPTFINCGDYVKWGYLSIVMISMILLTNLAIKKNRNNFFDCVVILFSILLCINMFLLLKHPNGLLNYYGLNFLGIRTRITDYAFPTFIVSFYQFITQKRNVYFIPIIVSIVSVFQNSVSTAYIGLFTFIIVYYIYLDTQKISHKKKKKYGSFLFIIGCFITYLIVVVRIGDILNPMLNNFFGKTSSFSGRTEIWDIAISVIKKHPFFGMGIINDGNFVPIYGFNGYYDTIMLRQAHNQTLQLLYDGGIISTLLFYYIMYKCFKKCNQYYNEKNVQVFPIALFSLMIMMITEIYSYYPAPYLLLFICYYPSGLVKMK